MQAAQTSLNQTAATPQQHELYMHAIESAVAVVVAFIVWRLSLAIIDRFFARRFLLRHPRSSTYVAPVKSLTGLVVFIALVLVLLNTWSVNVSPALLSAGFVTAALAFGAQWVIRDLLAGYSIFAEGQFDVGDKVQITTGVNSIVQGTVEAIGWRTTRLIDLQGRTVYIPNGNIYLTTNLSKGHERVEVTISLPLAASTSAMRSELEKATHAVVNEFKVSNAEVTATLDDVSAQQATFTVSVHAPQVRATLSDAAMRERIAAAFQAKGWLPGGASPSKPGETAT
jgi:moderate conductance mechanosensitive channel